MFGMFSVCTRLAADPPITDRHCQGDRVVVFSNWGGSVRYPVGLNWCSTREDSIGRHYLGFVLPKVARTCIHFSQCSVDLILRLP